MKPFEKLLLSNKAWAQEKINLSPTYFKELSKDQRPEFLWIGCSDSRVPAEEITGVEPGQIFVHRNVANMVIRSDFNLLSVLQYAVENLEIKHIIVCGHYGCGGVRAALSRQNFELLNKWIYYIKEGYHKNANEFVGLTEEQVSRRMVEINVCEQIKTLSRMMVIQRSWLKSKAPTLHGWVFSLDDGLLREHVQMGPDSPIDDIFRFHL